MSPISSINEDRLSVLDRLYSAANLQDLTDRLATLVRTMSGASRVSVLWCGPGVSGQATPEFVIPDAQSVSVRDWLHEHPGSRSLLLNGQPVPFDAALDIGEGSPSASPEYLLPLGGGREMQAVLRLEFNGPAVISGLENARDVCRSAEAFAARLRELEDLRSQHGNLSRLLFEIIHDSRTHLCAVSGYAKLLLTRQAGELSSTQLEYLEAIRARAASMVEVLNRASELTFEAGSQSPRFDLRELLLDAVEAVRARASRKAIEFGVRLWDTPCLLMGDRDKLTLALHKLLSEVIRVTPLAGAIETSLLLEQDEAVVRVSLSRLGATEFQKSAWVPPELEPAPFTPSSAAVEMIRIQGGRCLIEAGAARGWTLALRFPVARFEPASEVKRKYEQIHSAGSG